MSTARAGRRAGWKAGPQRAGEPLAAAASAGGRLREELRTLGEAARAVLVSRLNRAVFLGVGAGFALLYTLLLPYTYTQRLGFANWRYLNPRFLLFSLAFGLGIGWIFAIQAHATRRLLADRGAQVGSGLGGFLSMVGALVGLLPSLLCCSPLVPTVVALFGLSAAARVQTSGSIQRFFAGEENLLLGLGLAVVALASLWSLRKLAKAGCCESCGPRGREVVDG